MQFSQHPRYIPPTASYPARAVHNYILFGATVKIEHFKALSMSSINISLARQASELAEMISVRAIGYQLSHACSSVHTTKLCSVQRHA